MLNPMFEWDVANMSNNFKQKYICCKIRLHQEANKMLKRCKKWCSKGEFGDSKGLQQGDPL